MTVSPILREARSPIPLWRQRGAWNSSNTVSIMPSRGAARSPSPSSWRQRAWNNGSNVSVPFSFETTQMPSPSFRQRALINPKPKAAAFVLQGGKCVVIMRGLPGSGKSTYIRKHFDRATVCSADSYFLEEGEYVFDFSKIQQAHQACLERFILALENNHGLVVLDNTNCARWEYANYITLARIFGYRIKVCRTKFTWTWVHK